MNRVNLDIPTRICAFARRSLWLVAASVLLCVAAVSCDKAPRGVIGERSMAKLLVDLDKAEAYIGQYPDKFPTDSAKQALKQSIFAKHGVTQAEYDSSMVWYAHNIDVYTDVCERAMKSLSSEYDDLRKKQERGGAETAMADDGDDNEAPSMQRHHTYESRGDTADIWSGLRTWMFTPVLPKGYVTFDMRPDHEYRQGDRYQLNFNLTSDGARIGVLIGADYTDGTTTLVSRHAVADGWTQLELQTDDHRIVRRIYGYVRYDMTRAATVAFVDSLMLLRTHIDESRYSTMRVQRSFDRNVVAPAMRTSAKPVKTPAKPVAKLEFTPKPGVNKSSRQLHVGSSVNDAHRAR